MVRDPLRLGPFFPGIREAVALGIGALRAYSLRAALTIMSVATGIAAVVGASSSIAGLNQAVSTQMRALGASVVFVTASRPGERTSWEEAQRRRLLSREEVQAIAQNRRAIGALAPLAVVNGASVRHGTEEVFDAAVVATVAAYETVHDAYAERGRFFGEAEERRGARVAVLGAEVADALFPARDPIGQRVFIQEQPCVVVGVLERKGKLLGGNMDKVVLLPLGALQQPPPTEHWLVLNLKAISPSHVPDAIEEVRDRLRRSRRLRYWQGDDFAVFPQDLLTDLYRQATGGIFAAMTVLSSVGLLVGGIGVMNIVLVAVTERAGEIGLRRAVGATRRHILWQFLAEAATLTGLGGVLGIAVGQVIASVVDVLGHVPARLQPVWVVLALLTSVGIGVGFGLWPALKAAYLDPAEALRRE